MTEIRLIPTAGTPKVLLQALDPPPTEDGVEPPQVQFGVIRFADQFGVPLPVEAASIVLTGPLRLIDFFPLENSSKWMLRLFGGEADIAYPAILRVPGYPDSLLTLVMRQPVTTTPFRLVDLVGSFAGQIFQIVGRTVQGTMIVRGKEPFG